MDLNLVCGMLALLFFGAASAFWTYSWWIRDQTASILALWYCAIFSFAGLITLVLWRVTYS